MQLRHPRSRDFAYQALSLWHRPLSAHTAYGEVSVICNLIARRKVVCAIGLGFSVHSASIPAQAIIGCNGVSYSSTDHKAYLVYI